MRRIKSLRLYAKLSPSACFGIKSWKRLWPKLARSDGLLNSFPFSVRPHNQRMPSDAEPSHGNLNQSMSEGPLQPAHDAVAEVFCDVDRRHFIQIGITGFFRDLPGAPYAVILSVHHELISLSRAFRQHGFIDALDRNTKFCVVKFLLQNHQKVGRLCVEREELEKLG